MKSVSGPVIIALGLGAAAALNVGGARAADWHWDPRVDVGGHYDDNYGLESGNAQNVSVAGAFVDASLHASVLEPNSRFDVTPRVRSVYYPGKTQFDANDQFLDSEFHRRWQLVNLSFNEWYWRQDVQRSYLPTTAIGTQLGQSGAGADLASVSTRTRQDLLVLAPIATIDLSARQHLEVQAQYVDVDYSKIIPGQVQNFKNYSGGLGWGFATSAQSTLTIRGTAAELKPASGSGAHTYGAEGGWDTRLSERMHAYAKLGAEHTSFDLAQYGKSSATSISGGVGISRKFIAYDLFADYSRKVSPNSAGAVVARDDLRVRLEHEFSARYSGYVGLRGINQSALGTAVGFTDQRYGTAALGAEWRITRQLSITSEYAHTAFKDSHAARVAGSNAATISLRYEPHRPVEEFGVAIGR